ncbi:MAG: MarR family transcriptional regulator, partial [Sutterellaceae bacterium]|nr:MarR family transcriptional regulator [Sutterellaceae bacterium]
MCHIKKNPSNIPVAGRRPPAPNALIARELLVRGITDVVPAYGDILVALFDRDGMTMTDLAVHTHRTKSTISVLVVKLEKLGYVTRSQNEVDRRVSNVFLTEKGKNLKPVFQSVSRRLDSTMASALSQEEARVLEALLAKALAAFKE